MENDHLILYYLTTGLAHISILVESKILETSPLVKSLCAQSLVIHFLNTDTNSPNHLLIH